MKIAITVGIGLFISIIGLKLSGLMAISISLSPNSLGQVVQTHGNLVPPASEALLTLGNLHSGETFVSTIQPHLYSFIDGSQNSRFPLDWRFSNNNHLLCDRPFHNA